MHLRRSLTGALAAATLAGLVAPAAAQPSSSALESRLSTAAEQLAELEGRAADAVEDFNVAQAALASAETELADTATERAEVRAEIEQIRVATDAIARTLHKSGGANLQFSALLSAEGATEAGTRYATVQRVLRTHRGDVEALQAAQTRLAELEGRAQTLRDEAVANAAEVERQRARVESTIAAQADDIAALEEELAETREREQAAAAAEAARLRAREQAAQEAAREAATERAEQAAADAPAPAEEGAPATSSPAPTPPASPAPPAPAPSSSGGSDAGPSAPSPAPSPAPSTRSNAQVAVDTALAQVGKPYQYGANGPDRFDCSGLTSFAWRAAGVDITRTSRSQYAANRPISRSELQPGDLIFFRQPISHVAMYIGDGRVVEASRSGVPVRVSSTALSRNDITGYRRP